MALLPFVMRRAVAFLVLLALVGCDEPRLKPDKVGPPPPPGTKRITEAVDGLEVGHRLMAAGEYELALKAYTRAIGEQGLTVDVLSALGSANIQLGRLHQAKRLLEQAVEKDDSFAAAWNNLGVVLSTLGDLEEARLSFRAAFALDNGQSDEILQNLRKSITNLENAKADKPPQADFMLVRRGNGRYLLLQTKGAEQI